MKRICVLFLTALLCCLLCACGNETSEEITQLQRQIYTLEQSQATLETEHKAVLEDVATLKERLSAIEREASSDIHEESTFCLDYGLTEDGFDSGTVFVGDSLTYGLIINYLRPEGLLGEARYMAIGGMPLKQFFGGSLINGSEKALDRGNLYSPEFEGLSYAESLALAGESVETVYLMLGTNLGSESTWDKYVEVVDHILLYCPNATIFLQTVPYSSAETTNYITPNEGVRAACEHYAAAGVERVVLVDTFTALGRTHLISDGVHLSYSGQKCWFEYLKNLSTGTA